jgi:type IX secretion system PorP/SprF family membrane protein
MNLALKYRHFILLLLLCASTTCFAQQDGLFSQYMFNKLVINPAYAGSGQVMTFDLLDRYQWTGIEGAPRTLTLSGHTPIRNPHVGLGFYLYSDVAGPVSDLRFMATYAYRIRLDRGTLAFGLHAGFRSIEMRWDKLIVPDADLQLQGQGKNKITPDASFGIFYSTNQFYGGISSTQLLQNEYNMTIENGISRYSRLMRHFYAMTGFAIPIGEDVIFRPSALVKYVNKAPMQVDLDACFLFHDVFWIGAGYRTKEAVILLTELNIGHNLRIGYAYDIWLEGFRHNTTGSHEIHLGYDINLVKGRIFTPRYF